MKKNIEWLKSEILELSIKARHKENNQREWHMGHVMALFDVNKLIDQLDEPSKPVIPQFVVDYIEKWKYETLIMHEWFTFDHDDQDEDKVSKWLYNNDYETNKRRELMLIDAIRYGYEVEKEKKYIVDIEGILFLAKFDDEPDVDAYGETILYDDDYIIELTEKEIKDYDERYWAFAKEVTE